ALQEKSVAALVDTAPIDVVIATALGRTAQLWREHGVVMRAAVDLGSFGAGLKWEESRGGALFPHLYGGPLLLETVIAY
ncbi:DUF952 domain-containing protein, partial [Streptomyces scabiei]|uniref:DUF952 domain-containing protein n=1 Tax=Streptomyces scabiei TaxID=1930 RepID=UPI0038F763CC